MTVQVLFFGATSDITGQRCVDMELPPEATANIAFDEIKKTFPKLNDHKLHFAVNEKYATREEILSDGDELAIFTAVSGG